MMLHTTDVITIRLNASASAAENDYRNYHELNSNFTDNHLSFADDENVSFSDYAPFIRIYVDDFYEFLPEVEKLAALDEVSHTYLATESYMTYGFNDDIGLEPPPGGGGDSGDDPPGDYHVKVGIIDAGNIDPTMSDKLPEFDIMEMDPNVDVSTHATVVADVLVRELDYADGVELYTAYIFEQDLSDIYVAVDWLISNDVDIVNMSVGTSYFDSEGEYDSIAEYVDFIVEQHGITFVAAAGHTPPGEFTEDQYVVSPALGYNVIAVGAIETNNEIWAQSHYKTNDVHLGKPNLMAYHHAHIDPDLIGTSYSAPRVAGAIANLMAHHEILKGDPALVMSIIHGSSDGEIVDDDSYVSPYNGFNHKSGSGKVDSTEAFKMLFDEQFLRASVPDNYDGTPIELLGITFEVEKGERIRVSFASLAQLYEDANGHNLDGFTEYQVLLFKEDVQVESLTISRNYALMHHTADEAGSFTILVLQNSPFPDHVVTEDIAISYSVRDD